MPYDSHVVFCPRRTVFVGDGEGLPRGSLMMLLLLLLEEGAERADWCEVNVKDGEVAKWRSREKSRCAQSGVFIHPSAITRETYIRRNEKF